MSEDLQQELVAEARRFAIDAHRGQWRVDALGQACGEPFWRHLEAVHHALAFDHPDDRVRDATGLQVAWLHAVLERSDAHPDDLATRFDANVCAAVRLGSRRIRAVPGATKTEAVFWSMLRRAPRSLRAVKLIAHIDRLHVAMRWPQSGQLEALCEISRRHVMAVAQDDSHLTNQLLEALESARTAEARPPT